MTEIGRWLRFIVPGALLEALVAAWVLIDQHFFGTYGDLSVRGAGPVFVLGASLPAGFIAASIAAQLHWWPRLFVLPDNTAILDRRLVRERGARNRNRDAAGVEFQLESAREQSRHAVERVRHLLDRANGLAAASTAALLAAAVTIVLLVTHWPATLMSDRGLAVALTIVVQFALVLLFFRQQRRVMGFAEEEIRLILPPP